MLFEHPDTFGSMSIQGRLLFNGLIENGVECRACHYEQRPKEKEWNFKTYQPDVVLGIGWWVDTPNIVQGPQKFGLMPVPWLLADGWVANYHDILSSLPLVLTTSNWVKETYERDGVDVKNFEVLHVGFDDQAFHPIPKTNPGVQEIRKMFGIKDDEKMILTVGGDVTSKGAQEMIQALAKIDKQFPNWKYVCKATDSECATNHHQEELDLMQKVGISPSKIVYVTDDFGREFMPYLLNACDLYAAPSRLEGFGMIQVEAMACGTPVISVDAGGPRDTIIHGQTGFLSKVGATVDLMEEQVTNEMGYSDEFKIKFSKPKTFGYRGDIDDLAKYTLMLLSDDNLRKKMGEQAAVHALANFQYNKLAKRCIKIFQEKLNLK
jgi:starch synthase